MSRFLYNKHNNLYIKNITGFRRRWYDFFLLNLTGNFKQKSSQSVDIVFLLELFNTAAAIDELLLTCKERMTCWANFKSEFRLGRSRNKRISACASYFTFRVFRMDSFLHAFTSLPLRYSPLQIVCTDFVQLLYDNITIAVKSKIIFIRGVKFFRSFSRSNRIKKNTSSLF